MVANMWLKYYIPFWVVLLGWVFQPWSLLGGLIFFALAIVSFFVGALYHNRAVKKNNLQMMRQIMSHSRHDLANNVQVLIGYLALNKYDLMREYLNKLSDQFVHEAAISQIGHEPLSTDLLVAPRLLRECKLRIEMERAAKIPFDRYEVWYAAWRKVYEFIRCKLKHNQIVLSILPDIGSIVIKLKVENPLSIEATDELRLSLQKDGISLRMFNDLSGFMLKEKI